MSGKKENELWIELPRVRVHQEARGLEDLRKAAETQQERINWAMAIFAIPEVWKETMGEGVKVAILDTGIDSDHPDLEDAIEETKDFTNDGIEDTNGHGTHCAGVIGARLNSVGFVGVAPKCRLIIGKVLNNEGRGSYTWISNGIDWAVERKAHIISMSLGGSISTDELYAAVYQALAGGVFVVCAAGNAGSLYQNSIGYPGRYGGVITVASHDIDGNPSGFSSRGGELDVLAPGSEIWSTYKEGGYAVLSGTSMATPFVAGVSALITSKHINTPANETPLDNNADLLSHLMRMATHPGYHDNATGYGLLHPFQNIGS